VEPYLHSPIRLHGRMTISERLTNCWLSQLQTADPRPKKRLQHKKQKKVTRAPSAGRKRTPDASRWLQPLNHVFCTNLVGSMGPCGRKTSQQPQVAQKVASQPQMTPEHGGTSSNLNRTLTISIRISTLKQDPTHHNVCS
jgi:hypothetical protein